MYQIPELSLSMESCQHHLNDGWLNRMLISGSLYSLFSFFSFIFNVCLFVFDCCNIHITWASWVVQWLKKIHLLMWIRSLDWHDPLEKEMATHSSLFLLEKSHGQTNLVGCSPWGHKESGMT